MKLYLLKRLGDVDHDVADGFVVRAVSPTQARELIATPGPGKAYGDEGRECWLDHKQSSCEIINTDGEAAIILRDFNGG